MYFHIYILCQSMDLFYTDIYNFVSPSGKCQAKCLPPKSKELRPRTSFQEQHPASLL